MGNTDHNPKSWTVYTLEEKIISKTISLSNGMEVLVKKESKEADRVCKAEAGASVFKRIGG